MRSKLGTLLEAQASRAQGADEPGVRSELHEALHLDFALELALYTKRTDPDITTNPSRPLQVEVPLAADRAGHTTLEAQISPKDDRAGEFTI